MDRTGSRIPRLGRLRACREVVRSWRALTGGAGVRDTDRRTLIACSGGGDSSALVLALASRPASVVVGHVVHDLRAPADAIADRDRAAALAAACGLSFVQATVRVRGKKGNAEAAARAARYRALERLAREHQCRFVATAHQADDVLETLLMRLVRGAGPAGLSGPAPVRPMGRFTLIRPMLGLTSDEARAICKAAGWRWAEDATNAQTHRLRGFMRARVTPVIREAEPRAAKRAARTAILLGEVGELLRAQGERLLAMAESDRSTLRWDRRVLAEAPGVVVAEAIRLGARRVAGEKGSDQRGWTVLRRTCDCIRGTVHNRKEFVFGGSRVIVRGSTVELRAAATTNASG